MRTKKSFINMIVAISSNVLNVLVGLVARKIFLDLLGNECLGLNSLLTSIISSLSIVEMGLGTSIIYHLYKPLYDNDIEKVKSLMLFYKWSYRGIAVIIGVLGLLLLPFLPNIIGEINFEINYYILYLCFLIDAMCSYVLSYKRSILNANQENYIVQSIHLLYIVTMNGFQILILLLTKNFYLYVLIRVLFRILENLIISYIADKKYAYINEPAKKLDRETIRDIFKKVKGLLLNRIGNIVLTSSDNVVISLISGLEKVAVYSNYMLVANSLITVITSMYGSIQSSIGNFLAENNEKKKENYHNLVFSNFWLSTFTSTCLLCCIGDFISLWIGEEYKLSLFFTLGYTAFYFSRSMIFSSGAYKEAAGVFYEDRYMGIIEAITNTIISIILGKMIGLTGVVLGSFFTQIICFIFDYSKYLYKDVLKGNYSDYARMFMDFFITFFVISILSYLLCNLLNLGNPVVNLVKDIILSTGISNILLLIRYHKDKRFIYFRTIVTNKISKR